MRIHLASDFHLEFTPKWTYEPPKNVDINLIAGDVYPGPDMVNRLRKIGYHAPVLTTPGNHEFYDHKIDCLPEQRSGDINVLQGTAVIHGFGNDAVVFLGATLWTDFALDGTPAMSMIHAQRMMGCFSHIKHPTEPRPITPNETRIMHEQAVFWLNSEMAKHQGKRIVVMTHHAPSTRSISPQYYGSPLNPAFCSDLEWLMVKYKPVLWVHGHVHSSHDYMVDQTRVICNPRGYPHPYLDTFENPDFKPNLVVEI